MKIEWLRKLEDIKTLKEDWTALEDSVSSRTVFSSYDWIIAWYTHYGGVNGEPLVGTARVGGVLVAVAPLVLFKGTLAGLPVKRVDFAGYNSEAGEFLVADGHSGAVAKLLGSLRKKARIDLVCLNNIDDGSAILEAIKGFKTANRLRMELDIKRYASVDLSEGFDAYFSKMTAKFRSNIKRRVKRMEAAGGWRVDRIVPGQANSDTARFISRVFEITDASKKAGINGPMEDHHKRFYADVAERFAKRGMLDISILSINGIDAAVIFALVERGVIYDCMISYKIAFHEYSPGTVLMIEILKTLPGLGVRYVVSHGDHEYKRYWTSGFVNQYRAFIFEPSVMGLASQLAKFKIIPRVNKLKAALSNSDSKVHGSK